MTSSEITNALLCYDMVCYVVGMVCYGMIWYVVLCHVFGQPNEFNLRQLRIAAQQTNVFWITYNRARAGNVLFVLFVACSLSV